MSAKQNTKTTEKNILFSKTSTSSSSSSLKVASTSTATGDGELPPSPTLSTFSPSSPHVNPSKKNSSLKSDTSFPMISIQEDDVKKQVRPPVSTVTLQRLGCVLAETRRVDRGCGRCERKIFLKKDKRDYK
ncbi:unnamed protein product, partial [Cuscuta europaea]